MTSFVLPLFVAVGSVPSRSHRHFKRRRSLWATSTASGDELALLVNCQMPFVVEDGTLYWELLFSFDEHMPIKLTSNLRKCLATQPPCTEMEAIPVCCKRDCTETISRATGITIGDVVDAARRIVEEHEHCPAMVQLICQTDKWCTNMSPYPKFKGTTQLPEGHKDRLLEAKRQARVQAEAAEMVKEHEEAGWGEIWYAYRKALRTGK